MWWVLSSGDDRGGRSPVWWTRARRLVLMEFESRPVCVFYGIIYNITRCGGHSSFMEQLVMSAVSDTRSL